MKNTFIHFFILILIFASSCSKKTNPEQEEAIVTYTFNNQPTEIRGNYDPAKNKKTGSCFQKDSSNMQSGAAELALYTLYFRDNEDRQWFVRTTPLNKLATGTYRTTWENTHQVGWFSTQTMLIDVVAKYLEALYVRKPEDFAEITITNIHDGMIDGSFSLQVSTWDAWRQQQQIKVTDGTFRNCRIVKR